jgi:predicted RNase H-like HicB family nuclease
MKLFEYTVIFEPAEEGGYVAHVPALNDLATEGNTFDEAKAMAVDAIKGYIETLISLGQTVPVENSESAPVIEKLAVAV